MDLYLISYSSLSAIRIQTRLCLRARTDKMDYIHNYIKIPLHPCFGEIIKSSRLEMELNRTPAVELVSGNGGELSLKSLANYEQGKRGLQLEVAIKLI